MDNDQLDKAVVEMLTNVTTKQIGLIDPPAEIPEVPYAIVHPTLRVQSSDPGWDDPLNDRDVFYIIHCVATDSVGVAWMSDQVLKAFLTRAAGGEYENAIDIYPDEDAENGPFEVTGRSRVSQGAILPSGNKLYMSADEYELRING